MKNCTFEAQIKYLEKIIDKFGQHPSIYRLVGNFAFIEQLTELAAYCYEKVVLLEHEKQNLEIYERLGYLYYTANGFNLALGIAYFLKDNNYYPYYLKHIIQDLEKLAQIYREKNRNEDYFKCYRIILDFIPENLDIIDRLFEIFRQSKEIIFSSMINSKSLELITHYFPNYSHAYASLAFIEFKNRNYPKAEMFIQKFIETSKIDIQDYMHKIDDFDCSFLISEEYDKKRIDMINNLFNPFKKILSNREIWDLIESREWVLSEIDFDYFLLMSINAFNELLGLEDNDILLLEKINKGDIISLFSKDFTFLKNIDMVKQIKERLSPRFQFSSDPLAMNHEKFNRKPLYENYNYKPDYSFNILMYSIYLYTKDPELSMNVLKNLMIKAPKDALFQSLFIFSLYHFIFNQSVNPRLCHIVLKELPDVPLGYLQMAFLESNKGNFQNAVEWIWQALRVDPFNLKIWFVLSEFYYKIGNFRRQNLALFAADYLMNNTTLNVLKKRLLLVQNALDIFFIDENIIRKKIDDFRSSNQPKSNLNLIGEFFLDKIVKDISNPNNLTNTNKESEFLPINEESKTRDDDISNVLEFLKIIINMDEIDVNKLPISENTMYFLKESFETIENYQFYETLDQKDQEFQVYNPELLSNPKMKKILNLINRIEFIDCLNPDFSDNTSNEQNSLSFEESFESIIEQLVFFIKTVHWNSLKFTKFKRLALSILFDTLKAYSKKSVYKSQNDQFFKPLYRHYFTIAVFLKDTLLHSEALTISKRIIDYTNEPLFLLIDILSYIDDEEYTKAMENLNFLRLKYPNLRLLAALQLYIQMKINPSKIIIELFKMLYKQLRLIPYLDEIYQRIMNIDLLSDKRTDESISIFNLKDSYKYLNDFFTSIRGMNIQKAIIDINKTIMIDSESYNNMINYTFFHVFFGNPRYAIEFLVSNILLQKRTIESSLILSMIYMYENQYQNFFDLIDLVISQTERDLRPILLYELVLLGQENNPETIAALERCSSKLKLRNASDKYYFACVGFLNYISKNFETALYYLQNALQIFEINYDLLNIIIKNTIGEIYLFKKRFKEASEIFAGLIIDIETNFLKLDYSIIRQNKIYIVFDFLSAYIALKLVYAQVMTKKYTSAIKNAYALLDNPIFQYDLEIICGLLSFSYYSLNKMGSALYYLTQKIKTLKSPPHLRLLILIYLELADYQKIYELSLKYFKIQHSDELILELFLRSIIELQKYHEGIAYIGYIDLFPKNQLLKYFKAVILYYNNSTKDAKNLFFELASIFPDSISIRQLLEEENAPGHKNLFKNIPVEIEQRRYRNIAAEDPSKFLMDLFQHLQDSIKNYYKFKNKSIVDMIHLLLNVFNTDEEDVRIAIEEFELIASIQSVRKEYHNYFIEETNKTYFSPHTAIPHHEIEFWICLLFGLYSEKSRIQDYLKYKSFLEKRVRREIASKSTYTHICFFKFIAICEYYCVFEPEHSSSAIIDLIDDLSVSYKIIGFIFLITNNLLDPTHQEKIFRVFYDFCDHTEDSLLAIRYLDIHDLKYSMYSYPDDMIIDEPVKLILSFIEFIYKLYSNKTDVDTLASFLYKKIDLVKSSPLYVCVKESISRGVQTDKIIKKHYEESPSMKKLVEKFLNP